MWSIFWLASSPQFTVALLTRAVALLSSTVILMTETSFDDPLIFAVRLNMNLTPGLLSLKMCPSGSDDVNCPVTLASEGLDECSKLILHSKRGKEPCFGTSHENVWVLPRQKYTSYASCIDTVDSVQADTGNHACVEYCIIIWLRNFHWQLKLATYLKMLIKRNRVFEILQL